MLLMLLYIGCTERQSLTDGITMSFAEESKVTHLNFFPPNCCAVQSKEIH